MIKILNQKYDESAIAIHHIFQVSYRIEAELLGVTDFPPLNRTIADFQKSITEFYGYWKENELAGLIELESMDNSIHICSLIVNPIFFRQGIASILLNFAKDFSRTKIITVETGLANIPATRLYENFGFKEIKQFDTDIGVRKIRYSLKPKS